MRPSLEESRTAILESAIEVAIRILVERGLTFRPAKSQEEAHDIMENRAWPLAEGEDYKGAAACLMQAHQFISQETGIPRWGEMFLGTLLRTLSELGDRHFYDHGNSNEALECYQLAAGLDPSYEEALLGAMAVCLQGQPFRPEAGLPYAVVVANLNPSRDEVNYILSLITQDEGDAGSEWATAGGDSCRTGVSSNIIAPPLALAWSFGDCGWIEGGIAVSRSTAVFGDREGRIHAVDCQAGRRLWDYSLGGIVAGTPTIDGDRIFVGRATSAVCLELATGKELWK